MARLLFVLGDHEPTRRMLQTIELATAAAAAGGEVVLYLHGDGVHLSDPDRFVRIDRPYQGFESPRAMVRDALGAGVAFWLAQRSLDQFSMVPPTGTHAVNAEQLAASWTTFDHVITL